jgi:hypothetical protein
MRKNLLAISFLIFCFAAAAQQAMNNDAVIKLVKAGLSDDLIVTTINASPGTYDISTDGLIALKTAGVSDKVVAAIVVKATTPTPPTAPPPATPPAAQPAPSASPASTAGPSLPKGVDTVGIYHQTKDGSWEEVISYDVIVDSGGAIESFSKKMLKGNTSGHVEGGSSRFVVTLPTSFLLYMPEGRSPGEYQLVRFRIDKKGDREFRLTAKTPNPKSDAPARDTIDFDSKRIAPRLYQIDLGKDLGKGEYGILPPLDTDSKGNTNKEKIYTFSVAQ